MPLLLAGLLLSMTGCASFYEMIRPPRHQIIYATGSGEANLNIRKPIQDKEGRRPGPDFPSWGSETLNAKASAPISNEATSHVEAVALARRTAHDTILQDLATRVAALPAPKSGEKIANQLNARAKDKNEIEKIILSAKFTKDAENEAGQFNSEARLDLEPIALLLYGIKENAGDKSTTMSQPNETRAANINIPTDPLQRKAFDAALVNARKNLMSKLKQSPLDPNRTVENLMATNPASKHRVEVALDYAMKDSRIEDIRYPSPGACEVDLSLDPTPILENLKSPQTR